MNHIQVPPDGKGFSNGRNARYGAIELRQAYQTTLLKSLMMMCAGVITVVAIALYFRKDPPRPALSGQTLPAERIYEIPVDLDPEPPRKSDPAPKRMEPSGAATGIVAVSDTAADRDSSVTVQGDTTGTDTGNETPGGVASAGTGTTSEVTGDPNGTGLVRSDWEVNELPEFEGGLPALYRFIRQQTRYPERERMDGKQGSVYVRFIVDEEGFVSNVTLLNRAGEGFDQEALRVIRLLPKFRSPAKVNGKPVKVYYQVPITFRFH
jgi:periplasmic protein TonB